METVRPAVLLSIWYIDGDQESARLLVAQYPQSPEAAIVQNKVTLLPAPFWYFSPRNTLAAPGVPAPAEQPPPLGPAVKTPPPSSPAGPSASAESVTSGLYQQLGLFRNEAYARRLMDQAAAKGFSPILRTAIRSGETYYVVLVGENAERTMRDRLNAAGFECYPVYE